MDIVTAYSQWLRRHVLASQYSNYVNTEYADTREIIFQKTNKKVSNNLIWYFQKMHVLSVLSLKNSNMWHKNDVKNIMAAFYIQSSDNQTIGEIPPPLIKKCERWGVEGI